MKTRIVRKIDRFYVQRQFFGFLWLNVLISVCDGESASFGKLEAAKEARNRFYGPNALPAFEVIE